MAQLTVRNVPDDIVTALRVRAARNKRSAEAEHREILAAALSESATDFWTKAAAVRRRMPLVEIDSADLIREMRDSR